MSRANEPVAPVHWENESDMNATAPDGTVVSPCGGHRMYGLTIREEYAKAAMQAIILRRGGTPEICCFEAVQYADALLAELAKGSQP